MKFAKKFMQGMAWGDADGAKVIEDNVVDNTRWSIIHDIIFEYKGKFYQSGYSVGATESQDESPYEYEDAEIECAEVHQVEKTIKVWEPIKEEVKV